MNNWHQLIAVCQANDCDVQFAEPLRNHTTFRIGGACGAMVHINSPEALAQVLRLCRDQNYPYVIIGNGSNILAADSGYPGVILHFGRDFSKITIKDTIMHCQSGAMLVKAGMVSHRYGMSGWHSRYGRRRTLYECRRLRR